MKLTNLTTYLSENPYPGRGIVMGRTANNQVPIFEPTPPLFVLISLPLASAHRRAAKGSL